jgi:hypothetical protein
MKKATVAKKSGQRIASRPSKDERVSCFTFSTQATLSRRRFRLTPLAAFRSRPAQPGSAKG